MHYDLTISVPGDADDGRRMISRMVERRLVPRGRATYSSENGRVEIRWRRVLVDDEHEVPEAALTDALARLAAAAGATTSEEIPHMHLDIDPSRRLTQADFDPIDDL